MLRFFRMPSSVTLPGTFMFSRSLRLMCTSSRRTKNRFGVGMCLLKMSEAMAARAGCATHVLEEEEEPALVNSGLKAKRRISSGVDYEIFLGVWFLCGWVWLCCVFFCLV